MPTWYSVTLVFISILALFAAYARHSWLQSKGKAPHKPVFNWDEPEGAVIFLTIAGYAALVEPLRILGLAVPLFYVFRALYRGIKQPASPTYPTYPTNPKETSWNR